MSFFLLELAAWLSKCLLRDLGQKTVMCRRDNGPREGASWWNREANKQHYWIRERKVYAYRITEFEILLTISQFLNLQATMTVSLFLNFITEWIYTKSPVITAFVIAHETEHSVFWSFLFWWMGGHCRGTVLSGRHNESSMDLTDHTPKSQDGDVKFCSSKKPEGKAGFN